MYFALICIDKDESLSLRMKIREQHLEWLRPQEEAGTVVFGGPFLDDAGTMNGSLLVINVADKAEAEAFAEGDPYAKAGLFRSTDIKPWKWVAGRTADEQ